jgi:A/G-specific adenine glycosylase
MIRDTAAFRRDLLRWYDQNARDLPWRASKALWPVLVSEFMLQQTRVETVIPYFQRFMARFPDAAALARAPETEVLAAWSGLGYYSRARNLREAAAAITAQNPETYEQVRALPGVGPYTAAAVSSIALDLPHAAVDGNVLRVLARLTADASDIGAESTRARFRDADQRLLAPQRPGDFNQAMMELGATVCLPRSPHCLVCPVSKHCLARQTGRQDELPMKRPKPAVARAEAEVAVVRCGAGWLLKQRAARESRMADFWELPHPGDVPGVVLSLCGSFRHSIVNTRFTVAVYRGELDVTPDGLKSATVDDLETLPLTTISRKALNLEKRASAARPRGIRLQVARGE